MTKIKPYSLKEERLVTYGRLLEMYECGQQKTIRYQETRKKYLELCEKEIEQKFTD